MKKFIPTLIAIILIILIGGGIVVSQYIEKYSYSKEKQDLNEYFGIEAADDVAIILQDNKLDTKAKLIEGSVYLDFDSVSELLNDRFYIDRNENWLIYTTPDDVIKSKLGENTYYVSNGEVDFTKPITVLKNETIYVSLDYVAKFTKFDYTLFEDPLRIQLDTTWEEQTVATVNKDNAVRYKGGIKSPILREVNKGETVVILDKMDTWTKVKTDDSLMGYIENKFLENETTVQKVAKTDFEEPQYSSIHRDYKINLAWHAIYTKAGNDTFDEYTAKTKGINVISPTWFSLTDNTGNYTSFADSDYVAKAHSKGMEVWALLDNFSSDVNTAELMSYTSNREKLVNNLVNDLLMVGADGINLDFEQISYEAGEHYVQFIREMSVACRANGLVLSVDNYVPRESTTHYNRKEQGVVADYVIIMGYDEHWGSGGVAGSVASLPYVLDGIEQTLKDVPSEKVINAIPFYTRVWKTNGGDVSCDTLGMVDAIDFVKENGIETTWDEECCQNYGEKTMDGIDYQVWLEDNESIAAKLSVMDSHNLAGVAEWKLGFENSSVWDVIAAYLAK
ncbi:MAG: chitinase [Lachnospiraceae bacterium]|nr:chitinase [Lachnospiraceae bacterium]